MLSPFEQPFLKELQAAGMLSDCPVDPELSMIMGAQHSSGTTSRCASCATGTLVPEER